MAVDARQEMKEFLSLDALMTSFILENPQQFARWLHDQDKINKVPGRSLTTDEVIITISAQYIMAQALLGTSKTMFGGL